MTLPQPAFAGSGLQGFYCFRVFGLLAAGIRRSLFEVYVEERATLKSPANAIASRAFRKADANVTNRRTCTRTSKSEVITLALICDYADSFDGYPAHWPTKAATVQ